MKKTIPPHISQSFNRRAVLGLLLAGAAGTAMAQSAGGDLTTSPFPRAKPNDFYKRGIPTAQKLIEQSRVSGRPSFAVADMNGTVLETHDPINPLPPASVAKVITALYALEHLGPDFVFSTEIIATGPLVDGKIQGDLILKGSGDPTLDSDMLGTLAGTLVAQGIIGITGDFYVDGTALPRIELIDTEQTEYAGYNPTITGLNVNYNRVHFEWKKQSNGFDLKMDARAKTFAPPVKIASMRVVDRGLPVFDHVAGQERDDWTVAQSALGNGGARWLPVRLPTLYAGEVFAAVAKAQGLSLPKAKAIGARVGKVGEAQFLLTTHQSPKLTVLVKDMLKYSTNLTAEVLGLTASRAQGLAPQDLRGSAKAMSDWAEHNLNSRHLDFVDHSGLGGASLVTTTDMVRVLTASGVAAQLAPLLKPIAPRDGDYNVIKSPDFSIDAKTGTLDFVSTLAGYVTGADGRTLAFASFAADVPARVAAKASGAEVPRGAKTFNTRAKRLHQMLIGRWVATYANSA
ncbi:D-alanyl-D-alanine carboxypeptidase/D-alanyl-D-alanine-endopeptidase (penicillin-binding protein 4) [Pacificibacter maritimus]|uniref:D-alanyl-D-alanine carboxypeptidase/D-alanyl-D-alanine-endopeptidase (Penicillin-binding protein 4) n=1 Tax=Pacificibacter maritimus TaxID=762213 RepID=A0A3N4UR42_9RHOB|nr:D-alanyl-D-alanine carboxypeptidase/D-alanyl-D-alanine-endopeptidase [Pacificibacter maritimus]RPE67427.1 D-alanyl-D-alanine carboxypeptidase/D-alanyl-D-alanine-endopeptidase (penicillin-binding protein 4) [Pacificibacter maritimus]